MVRGQIVSSKTGSLSKYFKSFISVGLNFADETNYRIYVILPYRALSTVIILLFELNITLFISKVKKRKPAPEYQDL